MKKSIIKKNFNKGLFLILLASSLGNISSIETFAAQLSDITIKQVASNPKKQIPSTSEIKRITDTLLFVNGNQIQISNGIISYKDSTYLPMRLVAETLGAEVYWDNNYRVAQVSLNGKTLEIISQTNIGILTENNNSTIEEITAIVNGVKEDIPAINIDGSTYLPIRYISESLGLEIQYHNPHKETGQKTITIGQHTGLNYKLPEAPQGVHPINVGKTPTAPDGVDYNAKYLDYLLQKKSFANSSAEYGSTPVPEADFNKLFSQTHPKTGAKAIPDLFTISKGFFIPVFDHDGDGKIGDAKISDLSINDIDSISSNYNKEVRESQASFADISYKFETYNRYTYDGQFKDWFTKDGYIGPEK